MMLRVKVFVILVLTFFIAACSENKTDTVKPLLIFKNQFLDGVSANSVILEGEIQDVSSIISLTYTLNDGETYDVLDTLKGDIFKFTVSDLKFGSNTVIIHVSDALNNITTSKMSFIATFYPDVSGQWGDVTAGYSVCGDVADMVLVFDWTQATDQLTGSVIMAYLNDKSVGVFSGKVNTTGVVTGTANFDTPLGDKTASAYFQLQDGKIIGTLSFKGQSGTSCDGGVSYQDVIVQAELAKDVGVPPNPQDDNLEPNDTKEQATSIKDGFDRDLIFTFLDPDWFSFTITSTQIIKVHFVNAFNITDDRISMFIEDGNKDWLFPQQDGTFYTWLLEPGAYYLQLAMNIDGQSSIAYSLEFNLEDLPDADLEPNEQSNPSPVTLPFSRELYLTQNDEDWFEFYLEEATIVDAGPSFEKNLNFYDQNFELATTMNSGYQVLLEAGGPHYARVNGSAGLYNLTMLLRPLGDNELEPNQNPSTATVITRGFSGSMVVSDLDEDWYRFELISPETVQFDLKGLVEGVLYDASMSQIDAIQAQLNSLDPPTSKSLVAGTYYLKILEETEYPFMGYGFSFTY